MSPRESDFSGGLSKMISPRDVQVMPAKKVDRKSPEESEMVAKQIKNAMTKHSKSKPGVEIKSLSTIIEPAMYGTEESSYETTTRNNKKSMTREEKIYQKKLTDLKNMREELTF